MDWKEKYSELPPSSIAAGVDDAEADMLRWAVKNGVPGDR